MDDSRKSECECEETTERLDRLFQQHYSRKNKDTTGVPPPSSNAPLNDITKPSDDASRIDSKVQNSSPLRQQLAFRREVPHFGFGEKARAFRWREKEATSWGFSMLK